MDLEFVHCSWGFLSAGVSLCGTQFVRNPNLVTLLLRNLLQGRILIIAIVEGNEQGNDNNMRKKAGKSKGWININYTRSKGTRATKRQIDNNFMRERRICRTVYIFF